MFKRFFLFFLLGLVCCLPLQAATDIYGPISRQDTLWNIAEKLRPTKGVTTQQVMMALYQKNPHAFTVNNISSLRKGAHLLAPTAAEVKKIKRRTAIAMVQRHNSRWKKRRFVKTNAPVPAELKQRLATNTTDSKSAQTKVTPKQTTAATTETNTAQTNTSANQPATTTAESAQVAASNVKQTTQNTVAVKQNDVLTAQLREVQGELAKTKVENQRLNNELVALKKAQKQTALDSKVNGEIQTQLDALKHELAELRTILTEKNNHIKVLQTSLKEASQAIKSQHADNMRLYNKLKELSPASVAVATNTKGKPQLELAEVSPQATPVTALKPTLKPNDNSGIKQVWADEVANQNEKSSADKTEKATVDTSSSMTLSEILSDQTNVSTDQEKTSGFSFITTGRSATVSPVAWAAVLLSFIFILFMIVRALLMQNEIRRIELDETPNSDAKTGPLPTTA